MQKRVEDSQVEQIFMVHPEHLNGAGRLFGGQIMSWIDEVAALVGLRHAQSSIVTASVDNLEFMEGAHLNDMIVKQGRFFCPAHCHGVKQGRFFCPAPLP